MEIPALNVKGSRRTRSKACQGEIYHTKVNQVLPVGKYMSVGNGWKGKRNIEMPFLTESS